MPPRFFYFDMGKVLLDFDYEIAFRQMAELVSIKPEDVEEIILSGNLQVRYESGQITGRQFYDSFCEHAERIRGRAAPRPGYQALHRASSAMFELNFSMIPLIAQLRLSHKRMGILSNTCESHWEYCVGQFAVIRELFDVHVLSFEVGAMKPDPAIYRAAAEKVGISPPEIFFVDDRLENVQAARKEGFDAVHYTTTKTLSAALEDRGVRFNY